MKAYVLGDIEVLDEKAYSEYLRHGPASVEKYGGRFLARADQAHELEGEWHHHRIVLVEFPDRNSATRWYNSAEFAHARTLRESAAVVRYLLIPGLELT